MGWRSRFFGGFALAICLVELVGIWGTMAIAIQTRQHSYGWLVRPMAFLYVAGLASIPIAVVGLIKDTDRTLAFVAIPLGLINIFICVVPFIPY